MEPYIGYTYYDYTDISVNNFNKRTSSIGSNTSEYSFFISESTISLSSLEDNENIEKNNFKSIRLSSSGSLDGLGLKKTRSKKELFVKRTLKKRRKKNDICFINGKECINTRTPTPVMFNSLNSYFNK